MCDIPPKHTAYAGLRRNENHTVEENEQPVAYTSAQWITSTSAIAGSTRWGVRSPPASLEKTALVCDGTSWAPVLSYHPGKSFLYLGNRLSKESVPLSAAADLSHSTKTSLQHFLQAISFYSSSCPICSEVHSCKFHSVLRNLICRVWPQHFLSLQDF